MKLPNFTREKGNRFIYGFFIFYIIDVIINNPSLALGIALAYGVGAELYLKVQYSRNVDIMNIVFACLPGLFMLFN